MPHHLSTIVPQSEVLSSMPSTLSISPFPVSESDEGNDVSMIALCSLCETVVDFDRDCFKEHLQKEHVMQVYQCHLCYTSFLCEEDLAEHEKKQCQNDNINPSKISRVQGQWLCV